MLSEILVIIVVSIDSIFTKVKSWTIFEDFSASDSILNDFKDK